MICTHSLGFLIEWDQGVLWHQRIHRPLLSKLNLLHLQIYIYYTTPKVGSYQTRVFRDSQKSGCCPYSHLENLRIFEGYPQKILEARCCSHSRKFSKFENENSRVMSSRLPTLIPILFLSMNGMISRIWTS